MFAYVKPFLCEWCTFAPRFLSVEVTLIPIFNESQNVTCLSLLLHPLNSFLDATILPFCLTHAHYFFLHIHELVWLK